MVWIFQEGHLSGPLHFTAQPLDTSMLVLLFCIAFGLSMTDPGPAPVSAVPPIWALCRRSSPAMDRAHNVVICVLPGTVALAH